ncbi:regulator of volume decrease after cellular swelling-domain-containing protein [Chiua virens]|nr:regulator of volume decrease after cellular swelling-domain-containing protein [Chiua virens]
MSTVIVITTVPVFVSPDEHRAIVASTPSSFSDIPPVLRHKEVDVSATLDPPLDGFAPEDGASGTLYIVESALVFMSSTGRGFQIAYPAITLHATSRAQGRPSLYCQLDTTDTEDTSEKDIPDMHELTLVPSNPDALEPMFEALSHCASLHPDTNVSDDDDADGVVSEGQFETFDGDEGEELSQVGRAALAYLESIIDDPFHPGAEINGSVDGAEEVSSEQDEVKD